MLHVTTRDVCGGGELGQLEIRNASGKLECFKTETETVVQPYKKPRDGHFADVAS